MRGPNKPKPLGAPTTTSTRRPTTGNTSSPSRSVSSSAIEDGAISRKRALTLPSLPRRRISPKASPLSKPSLIPNPDGIEMTYEGNHDPDFQTQHGSSSIGMSARLPQPPSLDASTLSSLTYGGYVKTESEDAPSLSTDFSFVQGAQHPPSNACLSATDQFRSCSPRPRSTSSSTSLVYHDGNGSGSDGSPMTPHSSVEGQPYAGSEGDRGTLLQALEGMDGEGVLRYHSIVVGSEDRK